MPNWKGKPRDRYLNAELIKTFPSNLIAVIVPLFLLAVSSHLITRLCTKPHKRESLIDMHKKAIDTIDNRQIVFI